MVRVYLVDHAKAAAPELALPAQRRARHHPRRRKGLGGGRRRGGRRLRRPPSAVALAAACFDAAAARSAAAFRSAASYHGIVALLWLYLLGAVACGGLAYCGYSCLIDCQEVLRRTCK